MTKGRATMIRVSDHAVLRYRERVCDVSDEAARQSILSHAGAIRTAIGFGAPVVRCGDGTRLVIDGDTVVTVLGPGMRSAARIAA